MEVSRSSSEATGSAPPLLRRRARLEYGVLAASLCYFVWNCLYYYPYIVDDAFISLRYAYHLTSGHGLVYNPGERVEGFSNFLWVLLQSLLLKLDLLPIEGTKLLGGISGVGAVLLTYFLGLRLFRGQAHASLKTLLAVVLLAFNTGLAVWTQGGLETAFLAFLITAMCLRFEIELDSPRCLPWSALLFALAWMTRPEVPIYLLYFAVRRFSLREARARATDDLRWILTAGLIIVPYEAWGLWYYGQLVPATHAAKLADGDVARRLLQHLSGSTDLFDFAAKQGTGFGLLLCGGLAGAIWRHKTLRAPLWLIPLCGLIFVLYAPADWMPRHRFLIPILPLLFLLIGYGVGELVEAAGQARAGRIRAGWIASLLIVGALVADYARVQMFDGENEERVSVHDVDGRLAYRSRGFWFADVPGQLSRRHYPLEDSALFILSSVPPGETVVLRDIGFPGYASMNPIWDTGGLVTATAAKARGDVSEATDRAMLDELMSIRPGSFRLVLSRGRYGRINRRLVDWLESDPGANALYRRVVPEGALSKSTSLAIYLRKDLPNFDSWARLADAYTRLPKFEESVERRIEELR